MGKVVELDAPGAESRASRRGRQRRRPSKTALVLGGGGFTGGVYEIGALRALDLLAVNRTINDFDIYVGTSAGEVSAVDLATGLAGALPAGVYTGRGIERYVAEVLADPDRTDDFRLLEGELYLTATDLDTTERVVLGEGEWADVPISRAVAASGALPMLYEPVAIGDRHFIDGGIRSTTNVDVA